MRARSLLVLLPALLVGCKQAAGLVVVTVTSSALISGISSLHVVLTDGAASSTHDFPSQTSYSLGGGGYSPTFGVDVPASLHGTLMVQVDARSADGATIGSGDGMIATAAGRRRNVTVVLLPGAGGGGTDGGAMDGGSATVGDRFWVGSGGSSSAAGVSLGQSSGGFDVVGTVSSSSGASLSSGLFGSQTIP